MPLVSVIIPVYNGQAFLHEALESVFAQTLRDYEVICIDDGSTDNSQAILAKYQKSHGIRIYKQSHQGQSAARNLGTIKSKGEFVAFLDQDDLWYSHKLARQCMILEKQPNVVMVFCNSDRMNAEGHTIKKGVTKEERPLALRSPLGLLIGEGLVLPSSMMVRRLPLLEVGGFDPVLRGFEDFDLVTRLHRYGEFWFQEESAMCYRVHDKGCSRFERLRIIQSRDHFLLKMENLYKDDEYKLMLIRKMQADCYSDRGMYELGHGNTTQALQYFIRSLRKYPFKLRTISRLVRCVLQDFRNG